MAKLNSLDNVYANMMGLLCVILFAGSEAVADQLVTVIDESMCQIGGIALGQTKEAVRASIKVGRPKLVESDERIEVDGLYVYFGESKVVVVASENPRIGLPNELAPGAPRDTVVESLGPTHIDRKDLTEIFTYPCDQANQEYGKPTLLVLIESGIVDTLVLTYDDTYL